MQVRYIETRQLKDYEDSNKMSQKKRDLAKSESFKNSKKKARRNRRRGIMSKILAYFVYFVHFIIDTISEYCLNYYYGPKEVCPPIKTNQFVTKSATELAKLIREKKLKSYDVVKAYIDRINEVNPLLNAVVDGPFLEALEEAKKIDERIEKGQISEDEFSEKPYLGVPFTTKDSTAVKDKLHTLGLLSRKNFLAEEDAECVRLMKESGALIIATTNVPEVNRWVETRNLLIGQTKNPYDLRRSVGGSSGGEAALIAAGATPFGLGTDIGGSIRIPSFSCGVFGHKSTAGIVNMRGCTFRTGKEASTMVTAGPMTRYATDLMPIFKILAGPKNVIKLNLDEKVDVKKLKYYYIPQNNDLKATPICKEMQIAMNRVKEHFSKLTGETVQLAELPGIEYSSRMFRYWMTQETADFNSLLGNGVSVNPFVELAKKLIGKGEFTMAAIYSLIDGILPAEKADKVREITRQCDEALSELLGDDGILFYHSSPRTAPFHLYPLLKFNDFHYFSIFNVLHVPSTQVPLGLDSNGLPLGIQVVAARNRDRDCIAVAEELERSFGGWTMPKHIKSIDEKTRDSSKLGNTLKTRKKRGSEFSAFIAKEMEKIENDEIYSDLQYTVILTIRDALRKDRERRSRDARRQKYFKRKSSSYEPGCNTSREQMFKLHKSRSTIQEDSDTALVFDKLSSECTYPKVFEATFINKAEQDNKISSKNLATSQFLSKLTATYNNSTPYTKSPFNDVSPTTPTKSCLLPCSFASLKCNPTSVKGVHVDSISQAKRNSNKVAGAILAIEEDCGNGSCNLTPISPAYDILQLSNDGGIENKFSDVEYEK